MKPTAIDLLIVSGSRPELLETTLECFDVMLLSRFEIANVYANVDPFEGGANDSKLCIDLISDRFPGCHIRNPENSCFTGAVQWLWSKVTAPIALHLEDDWVIDRPVLPEDVFPYFDERTRQVAFLTKEKIFRPKSPYHYGFVRRRFLGISLGKRLNPDRPIFTTSPNFIERSFAIDCAARMRLDLDPEKQLYGNRNPDLADYTKAFRSRLLGKEGDYWISDIGRDHRDSQGIRKKLVDGQSYWIRDGEQP